MMPTGILNNAQGIPIKVAKVKRRLTIPEKTLLMYKYQNIICSNCQYFFINFILVRILIRVGIKLEDLMRLEDGAGEHVSRWNQIVPSLLNTFEKLKKLGFTYYNGQVLIIQPEKEEKHV